MKKKSPNKKVTSAAYTGRLTVSHTPASTSESQQSVAAGVKAKEEDDAMCENSQSDNADQNLMVEDSASTSASGKQGGAQDNKLLKQKFVKKCD